MFSREIKPTTCPRSIDPFYTVTYHIEWETTSWTFGKRERHPLYNNINFVTNRFNKWRDRKISKPV